LDENTLYDLLQGIEWIDLELKESREKVPESAYETVSAFLNTEGGHIILGVNDDHEITGIINVDQVQSAFIGELQNPARFGSPVHFEDYIKSHEDKNILIFYIPEARRQDKPVYVKTKKKGRVAFIRRGGGDYQCSHEDLNRLINDAQVLRPDCQPVDANIDTCFDEDSIKWFRYRYDNKGGNRALEHLSNHDFLAELGLIIEQKNQRLPTLAAIVLFGKTAIVRQRIPRPIVDCFYYRFASNHNNTGERWLKRTTCEYNLIQSWQAITDWYNSFAEVPFNLDPHTGQRIDQPVDYIAFRESVINLLSHQDFTDHTRWPVIENFKDRIKFWNPGDAFAHTKSLLEPGVKEVRNPNIVRALRDIGFSEQSGWGLREVYRNAHDLGRVPPQINNNKADKSFELSLSRQQLISKQQQQFQQSLGLKLSAIEADAFAMLCWHPNAAVTIAELTVSLDVTGAQIQKIIKHLLTQQLIQQTDEHSIALVEHIKNLKKQLIKENSDLTTDQVTDLTSGQVETNQKFSQKQHEILSFCKQPQSMKAIQAYLNLTSRSYIREKLLKPLIEADLLVMTNPNPKASNQQYVITEAGAALRVAMMNDE